MTASSGWRSEPGAPPPLATAGRVDEHAGRSTRRPSTTSNSAGSRCPTRSSPRRGRSVTVPRSRELCDPHGIGAVTTKSVAAYAWDGNPALRVAETAGGGMLNSVGLPGPGIEAWIAHDLPALEARGAQRDRVDLGSERRRVRGGGRTVESRRGSVGRARGESFVPERGSAPSCVRALCRRDRTAVTRVVETLGDALPVFAKLSPNVTDIVEIARGRRRRRDRAHVGEHGDGVRDRSRTRRSVLGAGGGGLSGAPIKPIALRAVWEVSRALPDTPIIGTGGVTHRSRRGRDVARRRARGRRRDRDLPRAACATADCRRTARMVRRSPRCTCS